MSGFNLPNLIAKCKTKKLPIPGHIAAVLDNNCNNKSNLLLQFLAKTATIASLIAAVKNRSNRLITYCCALNGCEAKTAAIDHLMTASISIYSISDFGFSPTTTIFPIGYMHLKST